MSKICKCENCGAAYCDEGLYAGCPYCQIRKLKDSLSRAEKGPWKKYTDHDVWVCRECDMHVYKSGYPTHLSHEPECPYSASPIIKRAEKAEAKLARVAALPDFIESQMEAADCPENEPDANYVVYLIRKTLEKGDAQ